MLHSEEGADFVDGLEMRRRDEGGLVLHHSTGYSGYRIRKSVIKVTLFPGIVQNSNTFPIAR